MKAKRKSQFSKYGRQDKIILSIGYFFNCIVCACNYCADFLHHSCIFYGSGNITE